MKAKLYRAADVATSQNHLGLGAIIEDDIQRLYPALRFHFPLTIFLTLGGLFVFTAPVVILVFDLLSGSNIHLLPVIIALAAGYITRIIIALEARQNIVAQLLAPITNVIVMILLFWSLLRYEIFKPRYKSRTGLL